MPPFVTQLRTPAEAILLAPQGADAVITIRVQMLEAWDAVKVIAEPRTSVSRVKAQSISGTCTLVTSVNGVSINTASVSSVLASATLSTAITAGQPIDLVISANAAAVGVSVSISYTR